MKKNWLLLAIFYAAQCRAQEHLAFKIRTNLEYANAKRESKIIADGRNSPWTSLIEVGEGVNLFGKLTPINSASVRMDYILVDPSQKNAAVSITALVGEPAAIEVDNKIKVSVLVEKTNPNK